MGKIFVIFVGKLTSTKTYRHSLPEHMQCSARIMKKTRHFLFMKITAVQIFTPRKLPAIYGAVFSTLIMHVVTLLGYKVCLYTYRVTWLK